MENLRLCQHCGNEIVGRRIIKNGAKPTRYCSRECNIKATTARHSKRRQESKQRIECPVCLAMFTPRTRDTKYCCRACGVMALAIRDFVKHHRRRLTKAHSVCQIPLPPRELIQVRKTNIRLRRETDDALPCDGPGGGGYGQSDADETADECGVGDGRHPSGGDRSRQQTDMLADANAA